MTKEELRKEFIEYYNSSFGENRNQEPVYPQPENLFEWFWKRLEEKERQLGLLEIDRNNKAILLEACESALRGRDELLKAADEVIDKDTEITNDCEKYFGANLMVSDFDKRRILLEKYNSLKSNP